MPFHVAIVPVLSPELQEQPSKEGNATDMLLQMGGQRFSAELLKALEERSFVKVTLLEAPTEQEGPISPEYWERLAREEVRADLLLTCRLWHGSEIQQELNSWAFGSFLVFSIGGPFCWFFPDRTYSSEAGVVVTAQDLSSAVISPAAVTPGLSAPECFGHTEILQELNLSFIERVGGTLWYYPVSVLIPSLFLGSDHEGLSEDYSGFVAKELAIDVAEGLFKRRTEILRNVTRYGFFLGRDDLVMERPRPGELRLVWTMHHDQRAGRNEPGEYSIRVAGFEQTFSVETSVLDASQTPLEGTPAGYRSFRFEKTLPLEPGDELVHLSVRTFGDSPQVRNYSIPIPADIGKPSR